ncbi:MAG: ABC transporter ATP-binding protein [Ignavibacteriae bacterium]|nr:ABC transporter ATP-binding protein [Ignavibacteriota bacterium]MCB9243522.1 ABC transporter ATP-binding protein [Ignavibacteriales bacterium]
MDKKVILSAKDLKKSYKITKKNYLDVLKGIDLEIYDSEVVAIVGKSGTGKSTLLHILGTLDKPDTGQVLFEGNDIFAMREKQISEFRNKSLGFIFQFHHLLPEFTALENVLIASMIGGTKNEDRARELMKEVGISERESHKPSELSGGEAQRVAIARALINSPRLVLADEPTGNLDSENADAIMELLFGLRDKFGHTFVIVTHNEDFAGRCDRVIRLQDGMVIK